jgi:hypothetical protein
MKKRRAMTAVGHIASTGLIRTMTAEIVIGTGTGVNGTRKRIENGTGVTGGNRTRKRNTGLGRSTITTASLIATEIGIRFTPRRIEGMC